MATTRESSFFQDLAIQSRVLHALMMRELITRYGRDNLGVLWLVGEPIVFTLGVTTLWSLAGLAHGGGGSLSWRSGSRATRPCSCGEMRPHNAAQASNRTNRCCSIAAFSSSTRSDAHCAGIVGATSSFIVLSFFFIFIGWMPVPENLLTESAGWFMLAWFGARFAPPVGGGTAFSLIVHRLWHRFLLFAVSHVRRSLHGGMVSEKAPERRFVSAHGSRRRTAAPWIFRERGAYALRHFVYGRVLSRNDAVRPVRCA